MAHVYDPVTDNRIVVSAAKAQELLSKGYLTDEQYHQSWITSGKVSPWHTPIEPEPSTLAEARQLALEKVDAATSAAILAGFDYVVDGQTLHFSYDSFDQQNFTDSANVATRILAGESNLPQDVVWNGYDETGALVRVALGPETFLALYTAGALAHKSACMETGGARKAAVMEAESVEAVNVLLEEWGI